MTAKWLFLVVASILSQGAIADDYTCPASLEIKEKLVSESTEWLGMYEKASGEIAYTNGTEISDAVKLIDVSLYSGEPKDQAALVPDNADTLSEEEGDALWSFSNADAQKTQPIYIVCHYEASNMGVFKKTAAPVKSCTWHFKPEAENNVVSCVPY
ncbi:MAG: hypothetical protein PHE17_15310 [Thiothrix sp.]|uniref:STY0301 family protein n=1 Tax=Thiothrix sp. TaxID=1032 RepID=UPI002637C347|nr:STY0301 family protein [Thiothrix sp.]MDD5394382.1 hypothetical protein [Thiothrix sp.]